MAGIANSFKTTQVRSYFCKENFADETYCCLGVLLVFFRLSLNTPVSAFRWTDQFGAGS